MKSALLDLYRMADAAPSPKRERALSYIVTIYETLSTGEPPEGISLLSRQPYRIPIPSSEMLEFSASKSSLPIIKILEQHGKESSNNNKSSS